MPDDEPSEPRRVSTVAPGIRYAAGLVFAQLLTAAEVVAVVISLSSQTFGGARSLLTQSNLVILIAVVLTGTVATGLGGYWNITPSLRWYVVGAEPDERQRRGAINIVRRQSVVLLVIWALSGAILISINQRAGLGPAVLIAVAVAIGGSSSVSTGLLFTQRGFRPVVAAASTEFVGRQTAPGVAARLAIMWLVNSALPAATIALLVLARVNGWFLPETASVEVPVLVLSFVSVFLGLRALILVSRSISDPVRDVVEAMAEVEHGQIGRTIDVYEQSEIGRLQSGFNRMVAGLIERDRLRDLFGRHVGPDVVRLAVETDESLSGEVRDVAILFIDLAGSTQLPASRTPQEVADVLNDFFQIVVAAVDEHGGLINKFQGDAALAVFGAPVPTDGAAAAALSTARTLAANLRRLPVVDFGIGVSAGTVFAGNIGAENRYEYTVIGDPVNEAARLADTAKTTPGRTVASGAAIDRAADGERRYWAEDGSVVLRGRSEATRISVPRGQNGHHD
ncbi:MAG TPA: adenylate/guanylate cyclase domain-containing protein [Mycobacterium sp.]|jgi:class 3 adenylate cyclase|nr:adenylate/guanylate cyclase domain-containing protein [Mycobacterium sp.]